MTRALPLALLLAGAAAIVAAGGCAGDRDGGRADGPVRIDVGRTDGPSAGDSSSDVDVPKVDSGGSTPGSPCPCSGNLICALGACRARCTDAACNEGGPCGAAEACVEITGVGHACVPAVGEGQACDVTTKLCASGLLCLSLGGLGDRCWRSCTNTACSSAANPKCWDIPNTTCKYCGPN